jgi:TolB-like protein
MNFGRPLGKVRLIAGFIAVVLSLCLWDKAGADMPTAQFLLIGQGARAEAMGQSVVANCFDETATYWNPAAMSFVPNPILGFSSADLGADNINSSYVAFVYPYKKFGFGFRYLAMNSTIDNYNASGDRLSQGLAENDSSTSLLASYRLVDCLSVGLGVGTINMKFTVPGMNLDAGANNNSLGILFKKNIVSLGASLSNLGGLIKLDSSASGESMPQTLNIGGALSLLQKKNLTVSAALQSVANDSNAGGMRLGAEYVFNQYFALRGGFIPIKNSDTETTLGFGLKYKRFGLDYAMTLAPGGAGDANVSRIGLSFKFGTIAEEEANKTELSAVPVAAANQVQAAPLTNIAVADFAGKNVSQADASIVADFLRTELVNTGKCNVVEKANMDKILAESAFQQSGCTTSECAVQIGKILNVKHMLVGSLSKLMDTYYITVNVVEVETSRIVASYDAEAMSSKELKAACKTLAQKLVNADSNK